ncbi:PREDICTED: lysosome-associated membrane glycoprotein 1 [Ceratosolen solmsi marchali]|uniref:Lysosome-associated membrane glycoprotein 5 n=1 Tax=Ceratosolen solmsi marchali TaxID=326594 RepID=A0AAJ6YX88_9HYME|nr:PREDICTED: lysosome-associated membrane glycoprotein 1 [Ceratosolen solmsi marchali]
MKKTIAGYLCCIIVFISGANSALLNDTISTPSSSVPSSNNNKTSGPLIALSTTSVPTTTISTTTEIVKTTTDNVNPTTKIPPVDPKPYKWIVNGTNSTIIIQMAVRLIIVYQNSTTKQNVSVQIDLPANNNTKADGNFTKSDETLTLSWKSSNQLNNSYLQLHFKRSANTYALNNLEVSINSKEIPNAALNSTLKLVHRGEHFNTSIGNSYRCVRLQTFNLTQTNGSAITGFLKVTDLQFEAFKTDKKTTFGLAEDCAFDTPDIVPIAVGCVLAGLVIIVLAAYLISRRRSEARGYLRSNLD